MTLFSLHHGSNFLGLVPPALWRDPGHCAGSRWGETERVTHPGKSEPLCGLRVLHMHMHLYTHTHKHTEPFSMHMKRSILNFRVWQMAYPDPFLVWFVLFLAQVGLPLHMWPAETPIFISPQCLKEERTWQTLLQLHPPFLLPLS